MGSPPMNLTPCSVVSNGDATSVTLGGTEKLSLPPAAREAINGTEQLTFGVRPEDIRLQPREGTQPINGLVELVEPLGGESLVHVRVGDDLFVMRAEGRTTVESDRPITLHLDMQRIYLFDRKGGRRVSRHGGHVMSGAIESPATFVKQPVRASKWGEVIETMRRDWMLYAMLAPALIWFLIFMYKPMYGLQIAFKHFSAFKGIEGSEWIGFAHFMTLFHSDQFLRAISNTLVISFYSLILAAPVPILLALMINEVHSKGFRKTVQTVLYLPHFISVVIVAGIVIAFLSPTTGLVNTALRALGLEQVHFLTRPEWFRGIYISSGIWKEAGFDSIIYLAAIMGINPALYESAQVDGATRWQMIWRITVPASCPPSRCCW